MRVKMLIPNAVLVKLGCRLKFDGPTSLFILGYPTTNTHPRGSRVYFMLQNHSKFQECSQANIL